jgi:hypothetical protein
LNQELGEIDNLPVKLFKRKQRKTKTEKELPKEEKRSSTPTLGNEAKKNATTKSQSLFFKEVEISHSISEDSVLLTINYQDSNCPP